MNLNLHFSLWRCEHPNFDVFQHILYRQKCQDSTKPILDLEIKKDFFFQIWNRQRIFLKNLLTYFWYLWRHNLHSIYYLHLGSYVSKALEDDFVSLFPVPCLILIYEKPYFSRVLKESTCLHNGNISWQLERERKALAAAKIDWRWSESDRNRLKLASAWPWKFISRTKDVISFWIQNLIKS